MEPGAGSRAAARSPAALRGQPGLPAGAAALPGTAPACRVPLALASPARDSPRDSGGEGGSGDAGERWKSSRRRAGKRCYLPTSRTGKLGEEKEGGQSTPLPSPAFPAAPPGVAGVAPLPEAARGNVLPPAAAPAPALPLLRPPRTASPPRRRR